MENQGFNLVTFEKVFTQEFKNLPEQLQSMPLNKIEGRCFPNTLKYYHDHVFKTTKGNYFVQTGNDKNVVTAFSAKTWDVVYSQTIKEFCPNLLKKDTTRYEVDIYDDNFTVCKTSRQINVARAFNFSFDDSMKIIEEEQAMLNELLEEYLLKVICNSNKDVYDFLLNLMSCYAHRKQSEIILIIVGEAGTGKSKFIELLQELYGSSCKMMSDQVMSGQDMFNSAMIGTSIGYIEETNGKGEANYTDIQRTLKRLSTSKYISCRQMQTDAYDVLNIMNFVVVTNFIKDIKHDRRNATIEPSTWRMNDKEFYAKITKIIKNKRVMQALFNMVYNRKGYNVWEQKVPTTDVMRDFVEGSSIKPIHEFFIDEFLFKTNVEKDNLPHLWESFKNYLAQKQVKFTPNETIFKHEARQFLTKIECKTLNKTWYDTSKQSITEALEKRKITNEMIQKMNPINIFEEAKEDEQNEYDIVAQQQKEINDLKKLVAEQTSIIKELRSMIENTKNVTDKKPKITIKKVTQEAIDAFEAMRTLV